MTYYAVKTCLKNGKRLVDLIEENLPASIDLGEERTIHIPLKRPQLVQPPDEYFFPAGKLASIEYTVEGSQSRPIEGTARIEPGAFQPSVVYTNVVTGEASRYALDQLPLGTTTASVGGFYFIAHPIRYYYCAGIEDDIVRWHLIESFQNADLITGTYTQKIKYSPHYIPVSDKRILSRLRKRLVDYTRRSLQHN